MYNKILSNYCFSEYINIKVPIFCMPFNPRGDIEKAEVNNILFDFFIIFQNIHQFIFLFY